MFDVSLQSLSEDQGSRISYRLGSVSGSQELAQYSEVWTHFSRVPLGALATFQESAPGLSPKLIWPLNAPTTKRSE